MRIERQSQIDSILPELKWGESIDIYGVEAITINKPLLRDVYCRGNSVVYVKANIQVIAIDNSAVFLYGSAKAMAADTAVVLAYGTSRVMAKGLACNDAVVVYNFSPLTTLMCCNNTKVIQKYESNTKV